MAKHHGRKIRGVMLSNEKYVGDVLYQKTFRTDCIRKKAKVNRGEVTRYLISNNHPAIIDRDPFNLVQAELARRTNKRKKFDSASMPSSSAQELRLRL